MHVWAPSGISPAAESILRDAGHEVSKAKFRFEEPECIWVRKLDSGYGEWAVKTGCRIVACPATGTDHLDPVRAAGVKVLSLRDCGDLSSIRATVEFTIASILALTRKLPAAVESVRRGEWDRMRYQGTDLAGKTAAIIGYGRIGSGVAEVLRALRVTCLVYDPPQGIRRSMMLEEVIDEADIVTVHVDLNDGSRGMFSGDEFAVMKRGSLFVNTSRGAVMCERGLLDALRSERIAGAALDVFCQEPLPADSPLLAFARGQPERLLLSPHLAGCSRESLEKSECLLAKKLCEVLADA